ncbi:hypothetical protein BDK51DRAFT_52940 [Blyttiomyces helicus]|uniref:Uncharacterized protein n=1 Tax=Blyttiomyces helicus TaxID=388810 RepID=A0A4V1IRR1_9FUNG|nr:hypothetical protein BDK51DRAFT_52940 [Blyttiomyces helicus]|eukprot:RKO90937.1 hypothetical protein BDK51DRAFT_52940 [Blyttiomyces helicus]
MQDKLREVLMLDRCLRTLPQHPTWAALAQSRKRGLSRCLEPVGKLIKPSHGTNPPLAWLTFSIDKSADRDLWKNLQGIRRHMLGMQGSLDEASLQRHLRKGECFQPTTRSSIRAHDLETRNQLLDYVWGHSSHLSLVGDVDYSAGSSPIRQSELLRLRPIFCDTIYLFRLIPSGVSWDYAKAVGPRYFVKAVYSITECQSKAHVINKLINDHDLPVPSPSYTCLVIAIQTADHLQSFDLARDFAVKSEQELQQIYTYFFRVDVAMDFGCCPNPTVLESLPGQMYGRQCYSETFESSDSPHESDDRFVLVRRKVYNKFAQMLESGGVQERIGMHLASWVNNEEQTLRSSIRRSQERGYTQVEVSFTSLEWYDVSVYMEYIDCFVGYLLYHEALVFCSIPQQWTTFCKQVTKSFMVLDYAHCRVLVCWWANERTKKLAGVMGPLSARQGKHRWYMETWMASCFLIGGSPSTLCIIEDTDDPNSLDLLSVTRIQVAASPEKVTYLFGGKKKSLWYGSYRHDERECKQFLRYNRSNDPADVGIVDTEAVRLRIHSERSGFLVSRPPHEPEWAPRIWDDSRTTEMLRYKLKYGQRMHLSDKQVGVPIKAVACSPRVYAKGIRFTVVDDEKCMWIANAQLSRMMEVHFPTDKPTTIVDKEVPFLFEFEILSLVSNEHAKKIPKIGWLRLHGGNNKLEIIDSAINIRDADRIDVLQEGTSYRVHALKGMQVYGVKKYCVAIDGKYYISNPWLQEILHDSYHKLVYYGQPFLIETTTRRCHPKSKRAYLAMRLTQVQKGTHPERGDSRKDSSTFRSMARQLCLADEAAGFCVPRTLLGPTKLGPGRAPEILSDKRCCSSRPSGLLTCAELGAKIHDDLLERQSLGLVDRGSPSQSQRHLLHTRNDLGGFGVLHVCNGPLVSCDRRQHVAGPVEPDEHLFFVLHDPCADLDLYILGNRLESVEDLWALSRFRPSNGLKDDGWALDGLKESVVVEILLFVGREEHSPFMVVAEIVCIYLSLLEEVYLQVPNGSDSKFREMGVEFIVRLSMCDLEMAPKKPQVVPDLGLESVSGIVLGKGRQLEKISDEDGLDTTEGVGRAPQGLEHEVHDLDHLGVDHGDFVDHDGIETEDLHSHFGIYPVEHLLGLRIANVVQVSDRTIEAEEAVYRLSSDVDCGYPRWSDEHADLSLLPEPVSDVGDHKGLAHSTGTGDKYILSSEGCFLEGALLQVVHPDLLF